MPLTRKITKATFDSLTGDNAWQQKAYKVDPGNANQYVLDAEPDEDTGALQRAKEFEKTEKEKALAKVAELETGKTKLETDLAEAKKGKGKDPKVEEVEQGWQTKFDTETAKIKAEAEAKEQKLTNHLKQSYAETVCEGVFTVPKLMVNEIASRIDIDLSGDAPKVRIMKDGKVSPMTRDELRKEYVDNKDYAGIINASFATGGGAGGGSGGAGGGAPKALKDMSEKERIDLHKSNPGEFARLTNEQSSAATPGQ